MADGQLGRIALVVDDMDAVAADLRKIFGLEFETFDLPHLDLRAGLGEDGIELVQPTAPSPPLGEHWRGPIAAVCLEVDDLEEMDARMEKAGFRPVREMSGRGEVRTLFYGASFHGIPLELYDRRGGQA